MRLSYGINYKSKFWSSNIFCDLQESMGVDLTLFRHMFFSIQFCWIKFVNTSKCFCFDKWLSRNYCRHNYFILWLLCRWYFADTYSVHCQTSKKGRFAKIVNVRYLTGYWIHLIFGCDKTRKIGKVHKALNAFDFKS